jgi:hypothetical protein
MFFDNRMLAVPLRFGSGVACVRLRVSYVNRAVERQPVRI